MSVLWAALLAAGALACLLGLPRPGGLRLEQVHPPGTGPPRHGPSPPRPAAVAPPVGRPGGVAASVAPLHAQAARSGRRRLLGSAAAVALGVAAVSAVAPVGVVPALLLVGGASAGVRLRRSRSVATARRLERSRAVEACSALAAELRAGRAPADALLAAGELASGPSRDALVAAARAARLGGDPAAALRPPDGTAVPEVLRALAVCWTVCSGSGSGLAAAVERLEEGLRADQAQRRAVDAELAGPRATAGLLAVLPVTGLLLAAGLGADPVHVLLSTPVGLACLVTGLLLDAAGLCWTGRLVARAGGTA